MPQEQPGIPPPRIPIRGYTTPVNKEGFFAERVDYTAADYRVIPRGTKYSSIVGADPKVVDQFAELYFLRESRETNAYPWATRFWATDTLAEDTYNSAVEYVSEAIDFPAYTRVYTVRRDSYDANTTLPTGEPLTSLVGIKIIDGGQDYTNATVTITGLGTGATGEAIVDVDGTIASIIVTNCGSGYTVAPTITIVGDGLGAVAIGIIQPQSAILVKQKKTEFPEEKLNTGGQAYMHPLKNEYVIVTRVYETLPGPEVTTIVFDRDGVLKTSTTQRVLAGTVVVSEELFGGYLTRTFEEAVDTVISNQITEVITVDSDSLLDLPALTTEIPNVIPEIFRALIPTHVITHIIKGAPLQPALVLGEFEHSERALTPLYKEVRSTVLDNIGAIPITITGLKETNDKKQVVTVTMTLELDTTVPTTPNEVRDVEFRKLGNGLAVEIVRVIPDVFPEDSYTKSIVNLIPERLRAAIPIKESTIDEVGSPSTDPTLLTGELSRTEGRLTEFTKRTRITSLGLVTVPVSIFTEQTTEKYGGGLTLTSETLDLSGVMTVLEGYTVVSCELIQLGNGYDVRTTEELVGTEWPIVSSRLWDSNMRLEYNETQQVVTAGTGEDANPGVFGWISEIKAIDKWRSNKTNISKSTPDYVDEASALISYTYKPYRFPGLLYFSGTGYYVRSADATLVQHLIKTWWVQSANPPTPPTIDEIILDDVVINNLSLSGLTYSGPVLHDDYTIGILFYPATTPSYTEYALGTPGAPTLQNFATLYSPGSTGGYVIGNIVTISSGGFTMSVTITFVYDVPSGPTGLIGGWTDNPGGTYPAGSYGPIAATGGSGSGAFFNVFAASVPTYTPPGWIGTYRIIGAEVTPEKEKDVWKFVTESVVMR